MSPRATSIQTPGTFGYLAGVLISCVLFGLLLVVPALPDYSFLNALAVLTLYVPLGAVGAAFVGAPVWLCGVVLLHLLCNRIANQGVHVAVAGLAGAALVVPFIRWTRLHDLGVGGPTYLAVIVGLSAAAGRAAVVPLVCSRLRLAAAGRLTGTARW